MTRSTLSTSTVTFDYPGASVGAIAVDPAFRSAWDALSDADATMYRAKQERRSQRVQ